MGLKLIMHVKRATEYIRGENTSLIKQKQKRGREDSNKTVRGKQSLVIEMGKFISPLFNTI